MEPFILLFSSTVHFGAFPYRMLQNNFHEVQATCYFASMLRCISYGWHIPCDYASIIPLNKVTGNYPAVALYSTHVDAELEKICSMQVLHPVLRSSARFSTPINAVIKNSDRNRALTIAGVGIKDQDTLTRVSSILFSQGLPKIKIRLLRHWSQFLFLLSTIQLSNHFRCFTDHYT